MGERERERERERNIGGWREGSVRNRELCFTYDKTVECEERRIQGLYR